MQDIKSGVFENMDKICKIVSINWCPQSELNYWEADLGGLCSMKSLKFCYSGNGAVRIYGGADRLSFKLIGDFNLSEEEKALTFPFDGKIRFIRVLNLTAKTFTLESFDGEYDDFERCEEKPQDFGAEDFDKTPWAREITEEDTYEAVKGLVSRVMGEKYVSWFEFSLAPGDTDSFTLSVKDGKISVTGRNGVSLAAGINHYLKYYCKCHVSQMGKQMNLPEEAPIFEGEITRYCRAKNRYAYNYCTHSYTMAFWGEEQWQQELDYLALNGVNLVLDITAQEEVWRRFMMKIGYTYEEVKKFLTGPAYFAWLYMSNMSAFGGPLPDSWFKKRTELARKNQFFMRAMGMEPVLEGYSGMIPADIAKKDPKVKVLPQGLWNKYERPWMVKTNTKSFHRYAKLFYESQAEVYGKSAHAYATDPFHEGGNRKGVSLYSVGKNIIGAMKKFDPKCVWVIQSWDKNPSTGILLAARKEKERLLILDLFAENKPHWKNFRGKEFHFTPWVFCMLNNFGGRMGLNGHLATLCNDVPDAMNTAKAMGGVGITQEASRSNPVMFDFFLEMPWQKTKDSAAEKTDVKLWLKDYAERRYGGESESAYEAWKLLLETVYNSTAGGGEGAPESAMCARPSENVKSASTWGTAFIYYDTEKFENAVKLLLKDYDKLSESSEYRYDVADCLRQVMSNRLQANQKAMGDAYKAKNLEAFKAESEKFLEKIHTTCDIIGTNPEWLVGGWISMAQDLCKDDDDFTKDLFMLNAKMLITTWGGQYQSDVGMLHDYSNRQWSGLAEDLYLKRWERWIEAKAKEIETGEKAHIDWFQQEWQWVCSRKEYPCVPSSKSLKEVGEKIFS